MNKKADKGNDKTTPIKYHAFSLYAANIIGDSPNIATDIIANRNTERKIESNMCSFMIVSFNGKFYEI